MSSTVTQPHLQALLKQGALAPLYLVVGEDDLLRDTALATFKAAVLGEGGDDFNCDIFYGDEAGGADIVACASEVAVFASRRLVVVKAADKLPARECEALLPYVQAPNEATTLLFIAPKMDGRLKFTQALARVAVSVDCSPPSDAQLIPWLKQDADRVGVRLSDEALHLLKEACGGSLYSVRRELEKLAAYVPSERAVTASDVEILRGIEPGASVFDLAMAIGVRDHGRVLGILARNLEAGEAPLRMLGSLAWQYRRLWKGKDLLKQGGREAEAARILRMDPYKVRAYLGQFSETHLSDALRWFLEVDAKLKGGSGGKPARIFEQLLLRLCDRAPSEGRSSAPSSPPSREPARTKPLSNVRTVTSGKRSKN
jgi:DNA polymerase III subunit delta